ncbi:MAG: type II secretion system secretin GspD [Pseudomonadota bacterium]
MKKTRKSILWLTALASLAYIGAAGAQENPPPPLPPDAVSAPPTRPSQPSTPPISSPVAAPVTSPVTSPAAPAAGTGPGAKVNPRDHLAPRTAPPAAPSPAQGIVTTDVPPPAPPPPHNPFSSGGKKEGKSDQSLLKQNDQGLVNLDFVDVEIGDIAKSISELTKRNFLMDDKIKGKITIISPKPVTVEEAYRAFISALEVKGFTIIPMGKILKIVQIQNMKGLPIATDEEKPSGGEDIFVTRLVPIRYTNAGEVVKALRALISRNGDVMSYDPTNTLILTDNVGNIRRLLKIVERLDQPGFQEAVVMIKLKYAPAVDTADKVMKIFSLQSSGGPAIPPPGAGMAGQSNQLISKVIPDDRTNSLIVVGNKEGANRVREVVQQIDQAVGDQMSKGKIHVLYLQYAEASELAGTLTGVSSGMRSSRGGSSPSRGGTMFPTTNPSYTPPVSSGPGGGGGMNVLGENMKITADAATNALIITASPNDFETILPVIRALDVRRPQAFVEAMILEVDVAKASSLGVAGNLATQMGKSDTTSLFGATTFGSTSSVFLPSTGSALQGLTVGMQGKTLEVPLAGGTNLTIPVFGGLFQALQTNGTINVLSTPNILTRDNMEAEIVVGSVVPFITAQGRDINNQPINQIQRENVAITLRVTPQINASDELTLDIYQENQDIVPGTDASTLGPSTSKRSAKTTVLVKDGQTITIGGLINDSVSTSVSKVPVLGDIPLIGWLFKSKSTTKKKTSLVIFITPYIIRLPEDLQDISIRKSNERQRFLEQNAIPENPAIERYKLDRSLEVIPARAKETPAFEPEEIPQEKEPEKETVKP